MKRLAGPGILLTAMLLTAATASPVLAQPQQQVWRQSSSNDEMTVFIDTASIARTGDAVRFWAEMRHAQPRTNEDGSRYDRLGVQAEMNCRGRTFQVLQIYMALGNDRSPASPVEGTAEPVSEGTTAEVDLRAVCLNEWAN